MHFLMIEDHIQCHSLYIVYKCHTISSCFVCLLVSVKGMACHDLSSYESFLNETPTVEELISCVDVGDQRKKFVAILGLDDQKLNDELPDGNAMFQLWLDTNPNATRRQLLEDLRKDPAGCTVAEKYEQSFKVNDTSCK